MAALEVGKVAFAGVVPAARRPVPYVRKATRRVSDWKG